MLRFSYICLFSILFLPLNAFADVRLAVLDFHGGDINEEFLLVLSEKVRTGVLNVHKGDLVNGEELIIMTRENMLTVLGDQSLSTDDCTGSCNVEIAKNVGVDFFISGTLSKTNELYVLSVEFYETAKSTLLGSESIEASQESDLIAGAEEIGTRIFKRALPLPEEVTSSNVQIGSNVLPSYPKAEENENQDTDEKKQVVSFSSTPEGATVLVNGTVECSATPCSKSFVPDQYEVSMQKDRHKIWVDKVDFQSTNMVTVSLEPNFGILEISSIYSGVQLKVDETIYTTPIQKIELDLGSHFVVIDDPCYQVQQFNFITEVGKTQIINDDLFLTRPAEIDITVHDPEGNELAATIDVDGATLGTSPSTYKVPLCSKIVRVSYQGMYTERELKLIENEPQKLDLTIDFVKVESTDSSRSTSMEEDNTDEIPENMDFTEEDKNFILIQDYMKLRIDGPQENDSPTEVGRVLNQQIFTKLLGLNHISDSLSKKISGESLSDIQKIDNLITLYLAYNNYAEAIGSSYIPDFLDEKLYKIFLEEQAFQYRKFGKEFLEMAWKIQQEFGFVDPIMKKNNFYFKQYLHEINDYRYTLWPQNGRWPLQEKEAEQIPLDVLNMLEYGAIQSAVKVLGNLSDLDAKHLYLILIGTSEEIKPVHTNSPELCGAYALGLPSKKKVKQLEKCFKKFNNDWFSKQIDLEKKIQVLEKEMKDNEPERIQRQKDYFEYGKKNYRAVASSLHTLSVCPQAQEKHKEVNMYLEKLKDLIDLNEYELHQEIQAFIFITQETIKSIKQLCGT